MKKLFIPAFILCLLTGCGNHGSRDIVSSSAPESSVESNTSRADDGKPFKIVYPENVSEGQLSKIAINDIYILQSNDNDYIVVDYYFFNGWFTEPASLCETYYDSMFIDGIETKRYFGDIPGSDARYTTKILSTSSANIKVGYIIKDLSRAKEFTLMLDLYTKMKIYEIKGNISDLRIEKE